MSSRIIAVIAIALLVADQASKALINTAPWAMHHRGPFWQLEAAFALLPMGVFLLYKPMRFAASLVLVGILGNLLSAFFHDDYVQNPFLFHSIAFNFADAVLFVGVAAFMVRLPRLGRDIYQWRLRRGLVWQ